MTTGEIRRAADALSTYIGRPPWRVAVGTGLENGRFVLIVYATKLREARRAVPTEMDGFPVIVKRMAHPRPAGLERKA